MTEQNGTSPDGPQQIYAHPDAIQQVRNQRTTHLRRQLEEAENTADALSAAYMTAQNTQVSLAAQNSKLQGENVKLREVCEQHQIDLVEAGIDSAPEDATST